MDQDYLNAIDGVLAQHAESTQPINIGSRPSAKSIYDQRKKYAQILSNADYNFHHRVEHLLTCELDNRLRNVQDCLKHLSLLHAEGKVWGQEMILQVANDELILADLESRESLENIPLQNIENCRAVTGSHPYNSLFVVTVQNRRSTNILLFQSDEHPANTLQKKLEKALSHRREDQQNKDNTRGKLQNIRTQNEFNERSYSPQSMQSLDSPRLGRSGRQTPQDSPASQRRDEPSVSFQPPSIPTQKSDTGRDIEVLNHVLTDVELFVGKLNIEKKKKKDKSISESDFIECFQKIKYGFNLLAKVQDQMSEPTAPDLVHILMDVLPKIISKCPGKNTASTVQSPFLTQKAILLLSACVTDKERKLWESLGDAWQRTREDWPNGKSVPAYTPTFSDGWIPPAASLPPFSNDQQEIQQSNRTPPTNRHFQPTQMNAGYDFDARNERELSVMKGESLKVLDKSRQWWMVENAQEQRGFVPSNILENASNNQQVRMRVETLRNSSTPEEVTDWLQDRGFSRITVRCLGVLRGDQLLDLSRADLKAVCPEEGGRVYAQLNEIRERDLLF